LTPNELVLTFRGSYVCANFGENRSRNATVRVPTDGETHTQTQTDFIICPMLYAIAMGQIIIRYFRLKNTHSSVNGSHKQIKIVGILHSISLKYGREDRCILSIQPASMLGMVRESTDPPLMDAAWADLSERGRGIWGLPNRPSPFLLAVLFCLYF